MSTLSALRSAAAEIAGTADVEARMSIYLDARRAYYAASDAAGADLDPEISEAWLAVIHASEAADRAHRVEAPIVDRMLAWSF